jgi:hypothetical protein
MFNPTKPHKLGTELCDEDRKAVLRNHIHRYTKTHIPRWAFLEREGKRFYEPQFADDADWLSHTYFQVREDGRLDETCWECHSYPTWPLSKEV